MKGFPNPLPAFKTFKKFKKIKEEAKRLDTLRDSWRGKNGRRKAKLERMETLSDGSFNY